MRERDGEKEIVKRERERQKKKKNAVLELNSAVCRMWSNSRVLLVIGRDRVGKRKNC